MKNSGRVAFFLPLPPSRSGRPQTFLFSDIRPVDEGNFSLRHPLKRRSSLYALHSIGIGFLPLFFCLSGPENVLDAEVTEPPLGMNSVYFISCTRAVRMKLKHSHNIHIFKGKQHNVSQKHFGEKKHGLWVNACHLWLGVFTYLINYGSSRKNKCVCNITGEKLGIYYLQSLIFLSV